MSQVNSHRHISLEEILHVLRKDRDERTKEDLKMLRMYLKGYQLFKEMELTLPEQQLNMLLREMKCQVKRKVVQKLNTVDDYQFILKENNNNKINTGKSIELSENDSRVLSTEDGKENNNESMVSSCIVAGQEQNLGKTVIIPGNNINKSILDGDSCEIVWMAILTKESMKNVAEKYQKMLCEDQIVFLRQMPFLADWSKILLTHLLETMKSRTFMKNQLAFKQGDSVQYIYLIKSGEFEVFKEIEADPEEPKQPSDEFINDLQEVFETYNELNLSVARNRNTSTKRNQRVAVLSAGESFGLKEIAEELEFRETSVICSSVNAEVLLLEKKVYFQRIVDKLTYEDLKTESNLRESWRTQRLNSSKCIFENSNLRKFQVQTNNIKNTLPTCLNNPEIKQIIQKQPAVSQPLQCSNSNNNSNSTLISKSLNVTITPQHASKSFKTPASQKPCEISYNQNQHSLDTIPSDLDNLPKTDRNSRKDPQFSRNSLSPGLEIEFVEEKTSPNKNEPKQLHALKGIQNSNSSSNLLRPIEGFENNNGFQRRENLAVLNRYNFIKNKSTSNNQQNGIQFSITHSNKDRQLKETKKQQLKNSNSIHRNKADSINKQNNITTNSNSENQPGDNSQKPNNNSTNYGHSMKDKELKGILTKDDLTIRFQQMVDIEEEMFEAQQQLHSGNVTPLGVGNGSTTPSTKNQTLKCFQKDFQSAENKFQKMTLLESLSQRDQFDKIYSQKKAFADRIVQRIQTARSLDQQNYPKQYFNILSPRESIDCTPQNKIGQVQFSHANTPQMKQNKKNQFQKKYYLRNPSIKKQQEKEQQDKKQVFTSATSLRFKTEEENGITQQQQQQIQSSPNERIITESTNNEERVFNISNNNNTENHSISWNDKLKYQGINDQELIERRTLTNHLTDSVRSLNNLSTSSRLIHNSASNLCNIKQEPTKKNKIELVFHQPKQSSQPNGKKFKGEDINHLNQGISCSVKNESRKSYTALQSLDSSDYNFFFSSQEDQYHQSAVITPSSKGNSNKFIKHTFKQQSTLDEQKYQKYQRKQSSTVIVNQTLQGEQQQQSQQNTPVLSQGVSALQSCQQTSPEQTPSGVIQAQQQQQQLSTFNKLLFHSPYQQSPVFSPTQLSSYQSGQEQLQRKGIQINEERQTTQDQGQQQLQQQKKEKGMRREFLKQLLSRGKDEQLFQQQKSSKSKATQSYSQLGLNSQLLTSSTPRQLVFSYIHSPTNTTSKHSLL